MSAPTKTLAADRQAEVEAIAREAISALGCAAYGQHRASNVKHYSKKADVLLERLDKATKGDSK